MTDIDDLIQRLRYGVACPVNGVTGDLATDMTDAANALETLRAELEKARKARTDEEILAAAEPFYVPYEGFVFVSDELIAFVRQQQG
jgi:hypothetical protein